TMITATAASAPAAATRAGPRSTLLAAAVQPKYTVRNSAVGTVTSCVVLTRWADAAAMTSSPVAAIPISSTGDGRPPPALWGPAPLLPAPSRPTRAVSDRAITAAPDRYALTAPSVSSTAAPAATARPAGPIAIASRSASGT